MASFKALVMGDKLRKDGTYNVKIRITHNRTSVRVATPLYVERSNVTRSLRIKDARIIDATDAIIAEWRRAVIDLGYAIDNLSARELADYLTSHSRDAHGFKLDMVAYTRIVAERKGRRNTRANYITLANSLARFSPLGKLDVSEVTSSFLRRFEEWLRGEGVSPASIHLYMSNLKAVHNAAKLEYNDEDRGLIRITQSPFARYKIPVAPLPEPRAIDLATLQRIADVDDEGAIRSLRNLARDMFMLSFALGGINAVDLYRLPYSAYKGGYIEYHRTKTKGSRLDKAYYRVAVEPEVRPLLERWLDPKKVHLLSLHLRYRTEQSFLIALPRAIKALERIVPYDRPYTYYAARHTYASLARNAVGLDKYTVHELLNHSDNEMRITDRYIERDWQRLYDAHRKVITLVDWSKITNCR